MRKAAMFLMVCGVLIAQAASEVFAADWDVRRVIVDAGHGGHDPGAISAGGVKEKDITLEVAHEIRSLLQGQGLDVLMTRNDDVFVPLSERARISNSKKSDLFVSVHANAAESPAARGFEIYYLSEATDDNALALERAENDSFAADDIDFQPMNTELRATLWDMIQSENRRESILLANHVAESIGCVVHIPKRRIKSAQFRVLKMTQCPAILVELSYLSNKADEKRLANPRYRKALAKAVVMGIMSYRNEFKQTSGFTQ